MPACPWPPHRGPFLAEGGKDWQEKDPAGALPHPRREVSRPLPHPDSSSASFCRGDPKRLSRPQVLVCVRVRRAAGRACYITLGSLRLGARWGRSLMTTLPPPAHHLVAHPLFSSHLLCPSLGEAKEPRPPPRAPLVSVPPFSSAAGSDHSFVLLRFYRSGCVLDN